MFHFELMLSGNDSVYSASEIVNESCSEACEVMKNLFGNSKVS